MCSFLCSAACGNAMCFKMVAVLLAIKFHALVVAIVFINILYKLKHAEISVLQKPAVITSRDKIKKRERLQGVRKIEKASSQHT